MDKSRIKILVVDDERGLCSGICEALRREGYGVEAAYDAATALVRVESDLFNVVLSDVRLPGASGLELLDAVRERQPETQFVLMTAFGTVETAVEAIKKGAFDYLSKPIDMTRLRLLVHKALEHQALVAENQELRQRLGRDAEPSPILGNSEVIRRVEQCAREVAGSDVTVMLEGESGTGKELVARLIHAKSPRAQKAFVSVNCAALPEDLMEAELFGHAKGAFTGAVADKAGRFQLADGGTLFLDEIGDLQARGQGNLLRVLEDGCFRTVGGTALLHVNTRVIVATNKDLQQAVRSGAFREDLFYRLQVVPITVPPLRERAEDVPLLMEAFLSHFCARHKRRRKRFSAEAIRVCQRYPWPGNVRQLRNLVERMVITCPRTVVEVGDLPEFLRALEASSVSLSIRAGMSLSEVEKLLIRQTLTHVTANREAAAAILGISRRSLQYKLKEYGLLDPSDSSNAKGESSDS